MISEIEVSDEQLKIVKQKLSDEGGAAGPELIAKTIRDNDNSEISDEEIIRAINSKDPKIQQSPDGDVINTTGLEESKKKSHL